jgi:hypothetical protein
VRTTGVFTIHSIAIPFSKFEQPIYIIPFGDVHRSSPLCHVPKWEKFLKWAEGKERAYFLGMGDYDDMASTSERSILLDRKIHDSTKQTLEQLYDRHTDRLVKELSFMKGRLLGLIEGNHYGEYLDGTTTTHRMARGLGTRYLGCSSFLRLMLAYQAKDGNRLAQTVSVDIWAHHGMGASRLVGGSLNRVEQMAEAASADIYLMGHDHKKSAATKNRLRLRGNNHGLRLSHQKVLLARTGSFLKGYEDGQPSYVADSAMGPTDLGVVKIELTPKREYGEGKRGVDNYVTEVDIHCSI